MNKPYGPNLTTVGLVYNGHTRELPEVTAMDGRLLYRCLRGPIHTWPL